MKIYAPSINSASDIFYAAKNNKLYKFNRRIVCSCSKEKSKNTADSSGNLADASRKCFEKNQTTSCAHKETENPDKNEFAVNRTEGNP